MEKLAKFIVEKKSIIFLIFIVSCIFCVFSRNWVNVCDDITEYLPDSTETRQGLTIMNKDFKTFATARVMISNITYDNAENIAEDLRKIDGVDTIDFDNTDKYYRDAAALFSVSFEGEETDEISLNAMQEIKDKLKDYDFYISSAVGEDKAASIAQEMIVVFAIAIIIIVSVLLFTSKTYMEIPVLLLTFGAAALLNIGTNYWFGTVSFVTNSVAVVLQLALGIDYAIILCHRYTEEREQSDAKTAVIKALSKSIPEVFSSSLTTVSGLVAMMFMQFRIGYDLGIVLVKAIICSLLSVFLLMPGLLMVFSPMIDKTHHKNFVPKINLLGKIVVKTRFVVPVLFVVLIVGGFYYSNKCPYVYGYSTLTTPKQNETQIAQAKINNTFGTTNIMALIVPSGDYEKEKKLISSLEALDDVDYTLGLANIEAMDGYVLTDKLTPRQFAEMIDIDYELATALYGAYAVNDTDYSKIISGLDNYSVPLIDIFDYLYTQVNEGYVPLNDELKDKLEDVHKQLDKAKVQLSSDDYSRILVSLKLPEESQETFDFLKEIHSTTERYYDTAYLVGDSTSDSELSQSFGNDNIVISVLSIIFVIAILIFTFKSVGLPILLIAVIQGSIWINFSLPYLQSQNLFFLAYLIVSSIQMGANIDYAIVISNRYMELKKEMPIFDAIIETLNQSFPTIITSGAILASAGIIIGQMSSECTISSIGVCLGRGTLLSMFLVMCVLPQILLMGDIIIEKTAFTVKKRDFVESHTGTIRLSGRVRGYVSGIIDADVKGIIHGTVNASIETGAIESSSDTLKQPTNSDDDTKVASDTEEVK